MSHISFKTWLQAIRPKTLTAAIAPVLIGTAMAFGDGVAHFSSAFLCLLAALSIQIGTNLANDYFDFVQGADTPDRIGPKRVTQSGLIAPSTVKLSFILTFIFSAFICLLLFKRGGFPIVLIGVLSIASGIFYTAGKKALGYIGLGDLFVLVFFGPVAVGGTYYVQSYEMNWAVLLAGVACGLISTAILVVNNLRDHTTDAKSDKKTLVVRFGISFGHTEFLLCIIGASLIPVLIVFLIDDHRFILWSSTISLMAINLIKRVLTCSDGPTLNSALAQTGKLLLIFSVIFSIGWML